MKVAAAGVVVLVTIALLGLLASKRIAERQAVHDAAQRTDLLVDTAVQPVVTDALAAGGPDAVAAFAKTMQQHVLTQGIVRVKLWSRSGRIVYSDEPRLQGLTFSLDDDEREAFVHPKTVADITDVSRPENRFERALGKSLEVYRPVWTASGAPLLFETYSPYRSVSSRASQMWRGFAGVTISSLLLLIALLTPILVGLQRRASRAARQRQALLEHAVQASADERQRIAATVHDGAVQDLVATSFSLSAKADRARQAGRQEDAAQLREAAQSVRSNIAALRALLVDIYPPNLQQAGLSAALEDLAGITRSRGVEVHLDVAPITAQAMDSADARLVYQVAQECLRNTVKHAHARGVWLSLSRQGSSVRLDIADDGIGFAAGDVVAGQPPDHFGLRLLTDLAMQAGAQLSVRSAPGHGTRWRLDIGDRTAASPSKRRRTRLAKGLTKGDARDIGADS